MSGWDGWANFTQGQAAAIYNPNVAATSPCSFKFGIGGDNAGVISLWAFNAGFPSECFPPEACKSIVEELKEGKGGCFTTPPPGLTMIRSIDSDNDIKVLCGKSKAKIDDKTSRAVYCAMSTNNLHIGVCDIENSNKGVEQEALKAFTYAVSKAIESGI